jgi:hypothetical protein
LTQWTRTGQIDSGRLSRLLKLGEPEAVMAVASAPSLTVDIARHSWWAYPEPETARTLLHHENIRRSSLGAELSRYIHEYLPFETEPIRLAESVRLLLLAGELSFFDRVALWRRGKRKTAILLGFVQACPFNLPTDYDDGKGMIACRSTLDFKNVNEWIEALFDIRGQALFATCKKILDAPADQDVVVTSLETLADLLQPIRPCDEPFETIESIESEIARVIDSDTGAGFTHAVNARQDKLESLMFLSLVGERLVRQYFSRSSTVGSLMRRQLGGVLDPVCRHLHNASV